MARLTVTVFNVDFWALAIVSFACEKEIIHLHEFIANQLSVTCFSDVCWFFGLEVVHVAIFMVEKQLTGS